MNISPLIYDCTAGYDGVAVEIYVSGCTRACHGCHNPQMQSFNYGYPLEYGELWRNLDYNKEWFDIISILGGDLLCQDEVERNTLIYRLDNDFPDKKLWLFTGAELSEVPRWCLEIFDVIKTGTYKEELRTSEGLASSNQRYHRKGVDYL
jgi:anaerobic ribonucleoside-triphosphate reductase activating protein